MNTSFERSEQKDEWLTPPELVKALGEFDLDPCQPIDPPFTHAKKGYNILDNGLAQDWFGRVWLNPPYGTETAKWLKRLSEHKNGIALTFARTETKMFFNYVWDKADSIFFIKGRLRFYNVLGERMGTAGAPSCLISYNKENSEILSKLSNGKFISLTFLI